MGRGFYFIKGEKKGLLDNRKQEKKKSSSFENSEGGNKGARVAAKGKVKDRVLLMSWFGSCDRTTFTVQVHFAQT